MAVSRAREFEADATGARICGEPLALASALSKVDRANEIEPFSEANPALSSLYFVKTDPGSWFVSLLSSHPSTEERIRRLEVMASKGT